MVDQLRRDDLEKAEFALGLYGEGDGTIDGTQLCKFFYAMDINPSIERMEKLGATKKKGEKKFKLEEVLPMLVELRKEIKDHGCYEDFVECLKLYDKAEDGHVMLAEISHALLSLGEKLTAKEVDELFDDCMDEEDDEGNVLYDPFLRRMCELDPPLKPQKKK